MTAFSDEMATEALALLTEFGQAVTLTRTTSGTYNPVSGTTSGDVETTATGYGYPDDYSSYEIANSIVELGDIRLYVNALSIEPKPGDEITLNSINYRIQNVKKYTVSGSNVLHELQLRL